MLLGFENENLGRAFPFLAGTVGIPNAAALSVEGMPNAVIVDAGFIVGPASGFVPGTHSIWLKYVARTGTNLLFVFASDAPGLIDRGLVFTRTTTAARWDTEFVDDFAGPFDISESPDALYSETSDFSDFGSECDPEPLWSGYLVTGDVTVIGLTDGQSLTRTTATGTTVEPGLIQSLAGSLITSINLANLDRTRSSGPPGCPDPIWPYPTGGVYVSAKCIQGHVRVKAGYNMSVTQDDNANAINLGAAVGAGLGQPCDEVPLFDGEVPPAGSDAYEGGPLCGEVITGINGIGGAASAILGGQGVTVLPMPDQHTILINVGMSGMAVCYSDAFSEVSEPL